MHLFAIGLLASWLGSFSQGIILTKWAHLEDVSCKDETIQLWKKLVALRNIVIRLSSVDIRHMGLEYSVGRVIVRTTWQQNKTPKVLYQHLNVF